VPGRSFAKHNLVALAMVMLTGMALLFTMAFTMLSATSEGLMLRLRASGELRNLSLLISRVVPLAVTFAFFFLVYRFVPRKATTGRHAAVGAMLATTLWEAAKSAFAYYIRNVAQYSGIYGTLEGIIVLALWLEISVSIILYCGEVVALLIHQQAAAKAALASATSEPPTAENVGGPATAP
jgi:membrane protein